MTDKELLELAAKAAGYELQETEDGCEIDFDDSRIWNPLTDDGDALRLAVRLRFRHECCNSGMVYVWRGSELVHTEFALHENSDNERCAASRRAIVRVAAEIGKASSNANSD